MFHNHAGQYQSYFWLYAPMGKVKLKKPKKTNLAAIFDRHAQGTNTVAKLLSQPSNLVPAEDRHLTIFEQPRRACADNPGDFRYQPMADVESLVNMVQVMQDIADDYMPLRYSAKRLEVFEKTNKIQMALGFNKEAREAFGAFYDDLMGELADTFKMYDLYKGERVPRVMISKGYKSDLQGGIGKDKKAMRQLIASFNEQGAKLVSKPIDFDRLILGQGLYDVKGQRLASRTVATVYFEKRPFEWHCDDPFDRYANAQLIEKVRRRREQERVNGRRYPLLAA